MQPVSWARSCPACGARPGEPCARCTYTERTGYMPLSPPCAMPGMQVHDERKVWT